MRRFQDSHSRKSFPFRVEAARPKWHFFLICQWLAGGPLGVVTGTIGGLTSGSSPLGAVTGILGGGGSSPLDTVTGAVGGLTGGSSPPKNSLLAGTKACFILKTH